MIVINGTLAPVKRMDRQSRQDQAADPSYILSFPTTNVPPSLALISFLWLWELSGGDDKAHSSIRGLCQWRRKWECDPSVEKQRGQNTHASPWPSLAAFLWAEAAGAREETLAPPGKFGEASWHMRAQL